MRSHLNSTQESDSFNISRTFLKKKNWQEEKRQLFTNLAIFHLNANFEHRTLVLNLIQLSGPMFQHHNWSDLYSVLLSSLSWKDSGRVQNQPSKHNRWCTGLVFRTTTYWQKCKSKSRSEVCAIHLLCPRCPAHTLTLGKSALFWLNRTLIYTDITWSIPWSVLIPTRTSAIKITQIHLIYFSGHKEY